MNNKGNSSPHGGKEEKKKKGEEKRGREGRKERRAGERKGQGQGNSENEEPSASFKVSLGPYFLQVSSTSQSLHIHLEQSHQLEPSIRRESVAERGWGGRLDIHTTAPTFYPLHLSVFNLISSLLIQAPSQNVTFNFIILVFLGSPLPPSTMVVSLP